MGLFPAGRAAVWESPEAERQNMGIYRNSRNCKNRQGRLGPWRFLYLYPDLFPCRSGGAPEVKISSCPLPQHPLYLFQIGIAEQGEDIRQLLRGQVPPAEAEEKGL